MFQVVTCLLGYTLDCLIVIKVLVYLQLTKARNIF